MTRMKKLILILQLVVIAALFAFIPSSARGYRPTAEQIDQFRITAEELGTIGHWSVNGYMIRESDALVMTRIALGEAPYCPQDQEYVMWNIRVRAELGYKNYGSGTPAHKIDRWGAPTSIQMEGLCVRSCQYQIMVLAERVINPKNADLTILRLMLYPEDGSQLRQFYRAYRMARRILLRPLTDMPEELQGYDSFVAPSRGGTGWNDWKPNGLKRVQFFTCGNVWVDRLKEDNRWFFMQDEEAE